jgi:hypothetical protein
MSLLSRYDRWLTGFLVALAALPGDGQAQTQADELAKQLANPVAALISVPFQFNFDWGYGSEDGSRQNLTVQPVIPASISDNWNLITRIITPVTNQNDLNGASGHQFGLGDITPSFFFSPKAPTSGGLIWGVGPVFLLPTATDDALGADKFGMGPSFLVLKQVSSWTYGALVNHIWSVAGNEDRSDISNTFMQPFLAKGFPGGRTLMFNLESVYDWEGETWFIPLNVNYSKVTKIAGQLVSLGGGPRVYLATPGDGPTWGFRFTATMLFPK